MAVALITEADVRELSSLAVPGAGAAYWSIPLQRLAPEAPPMP